MTYRIEITAGTLSELADKLTVLAGQFQTTPVSKGVYAGPALAAIPILTDESTREPDAAQTPAATIAAPAITYEADIAPRVLRLVDRAGREAAIALLGKFGVKKASSLTAAQYPDFIDAVDLALASA